MGSMNAYMEWVLVKEALNKVKMWIMWEVDSIRLTLKMIHTPTCTNRVRKTTQTFDERTTKTNIYQRTLKHSKTNQIKSISKDLTIKTNNSKTKPTVSIINPNIQLRKQVKYERASQLSFSK